MNTAAMDDLQNALYKIEADCEDEIDRCRELSLACTKVEESIMWLRKAYRAKGHYVAAES